MSALTVLTATGRKQMAKAWAADGTIRGTDEARWFKLTTVPVSDLADLSAKLTVLAGKPQSCVIRQAPVSPDLLAQLTQEDGYRPGLVLRQSKYFADQPLHPIMIDVDGWPHEGDPVAGMHAFIAAQLPECFHGADFHWQLSGSSGHPSRAGKLNAHLWFWLRTPYTSAQLYAWAKTLPGVDAAVYRPVQAHYTADPVFDEGVVDPVPVRSGMETLFISEDVDLVLDEAALAAVHAPSLRGVARSSDAGLDPVADYLYDHWTVYGEKDGRLQILCPMAEYHSGDSGVTQCVWTQNGVGGVAAGGVYCVHETHGGKGKLTTSLFLKLIGYTEVETAAEFDVIERTTPEGEDEESEAPLPDGSEQQLADVFAYVGQDRYRWTPGLDWLVNTGSHWARDDLLTRYSAAKEVCRQAALGQKKGAATKICASSTSNSLLSLARSASTIATPINAWDQHPMLLNTPTGVFDLETGREVSREGLLFTQTTGFAPQPMAIPVWQRFISEVFGGDLEMVEFMQRVLGYSLTGSVREQKLFFMHGAGSNGKNVMVDMLFKLGGRYAHNLPSEALMTSKHQTHSTMFAALHGKRMAISSEIEESAHWAESKIKSLTGDATMTARFMRQDDFTFNITHKHIIAGNHKPRLKGDDGAMVRRMILIPFLQQFTGVRADTKLPDKLALEAPGILAWAIEGARKWANSGLAVPNTVAAASREYMAENDDMALWMLECCNVNPAATTRSSTLYTSFAQWKQRNGEHPSSIKAFSQRLERFHKKAHSMHGNVFLGLELTSAGDFDVQEITV